MTLIAGVTGIVAGKALDQAFVSVGGIVLGIAIPLPTLSQLTLGSETTLHTHLLVREDDLALYGFATMEERDLFVKLIAVSGVGPRLGLAMLSAHAPDALCRAILNDDLDRLSRTPGIGKKLAQRLVLELKAPITKFMASAPNLAAAAGATTYSMKDTRDMDAVDALTGLGYGAPEVQAALRNVPDAENLSLDELIVKVLRVLAR